MGRSVKHKSWEPDQTPQGDAVPSSSGIFKTLFGDAPDQNATDSIFSDDNPFRSKPQASLAPAQGFAEAESFRSANNVRCGNPNSAYDLEQKKRKRSKEKLPDIEADPMAEASETLVGTKKSKEEKLPNPNLGAASEGEMQKDKGGNPSLGSESNRQAVKEEGQPTELGHVSNGENPDLGSESRSMDKNMKKQKKRKRDELEREYEMKKYGAAENERGEGKELLKEKKKVVGEKRKTMENLEHMVISPDGFDDESKLLRTVFVGNLPLKVKKKALIKEFKQFGEVESVRIRSVPIVDTKKPRKEAILTRQFNEAVDSVHAYIVFKTEESAQASLSHNMALVICVGVSLTDSSLEEITFVLTGRAHLGRSLKGSVSLYDIKRTVFVGNLPYDVKDEELYQLFSGIDNLGSSIEAIRVIRHPHISLGKGIAYVLLKTREAANLAVKKRKLKLRDRELRVSHARRDTTPSATPLKRQSTFPAQTANSPAKRLALRPRTSDSNARANAKAPLSYQGLRASKSGVQKKVHHPKSIRSADTNSKCQSGEKLKERKGKRPAVAARKAKANVLKDGGSSTQGGTKRKLDRQTPQSFQQKKAKKFK